MLSAVITTGGGYRAMPLARQLAHQRSVQPGPLVLGPAPRKSLAPTVDRDRPVSRRSEPSSRTALMGEQPNPWDLIQPKDAMSRHRGAERRRRCELLDVTSLLSPGELLSGKPRPFHPVPWDHSARLSSLLGLFASQSSPLIPLHSMCDFQPH